MTTYGFELIEMRPARQNGKSIVYSQQAIGFQPVSSHHSVLTDPQPQPQAQAQAQAQTQAVID